MSACHQSSLYRLRFVFVQHLYLHVVSQKPQISIAHTTGRLLVSVWSMKKWYIYIHTRPSVIERHIMYAIKKKMYPTQQMQHLQKAEASQHTQSSLSDIIYSLIFTATLLCLCWKETPQHFTLASGILCTEYRLQSQQSAENRCHQTRSIVSSVLSASPVTLPALSLYPRASSITYQAGRSDVTAPAHTTTTPQTPSTKLRCKTQRLQVPRSTWPAALESLSI